MDDGHRIVTWPQAPLPVPLVPVGRYALFDDQGIRLTEGGVRGVALPDELYLRELMDVDLADIEAVLRFCNRHGPLRLGDDLRLVRPTFLFSSDAPPLDFDCGFDDLRDVMDEDEPQDADEEDLPSTRSFETWLRAKEAGHGRDKAEYILESNDELVGEALILRTWLRSHVLAERAGFPTATAERPLGRSNPIAQSIQLPAVTGEEWPSGMASPLTTAVFHADEFRLLASQMRDVVRVLGAFDGRMTWADVAAAWESKHWGPPILDEDEGEEDYLWFVASALGLVERGVALWSPTLRLEGSWDYAGLFARRVPSTYEALCLQLFNDVAAGLPWRTCRKCGRSFRRQIGRAQFGQYRLAGDVDYCSPDCATAARSKTRRDNIRRATGLARDGLTAAAIANVMSAEPGQPVTEKQVERWLAAATRRRKTEGKPQA